MVCEAHFCAAEEGEGAEEDAQGETGFSFSYAVRVGELGDSLVEVDVETPSEIVVDAVYHQVQDYCDWHSVALH